MRKGFVVSAVLYPLLVMFLVLVMGILAMGQNRRKILDNMKLEVSEESETDPEMSNSALYYKMKALEEAYAEMSSRLSEERFEELEELLKKYTDTKSQAAETAAINSATTSSNNYTNNSINNLNTTLTANINSTRTSLQSEINTAKTQAISTAKTQTKLEAFPVGSIFISTTSTNPSSYIGGTWESYGQGRTLIGVGSNGTTTYSLGATGGSETHSHGYGSYYALLRKNGSVLYMTDQKQNWSTSFAGNFASDGGAKVTSQDKAVGIRGTSPSATSMQPYIVVYFWKRVA